VINASEGSLCFQNYFFLVDYILSIGNTYHTDKTVKDLMGHIGCAFYYVTKHLLHGLIVLAYFVMDQLIDPKEKKRRSVL
jgi:hypothetical protein